MLFIASMCSMAFWLRPSAGNVTEHGLLSGVTLDAILGIDDVTVRPLELVGLFLHPSGVVMWMLLLSLLLLLAQDAVGQFLDVTNTPGGAPLVLSLIASSIWPWLLREAPLLAAFLAMVAMVAALRAAAESAGKLRPATGFLAGWSIAVATAILAGLIGAEIGLTLQQAAIAAMLPAALIGMGWQARIGGAFSYSAALIWAFCGVAASTMASDPSVAVAAIIGTTGMTVALIRAAS